MGKRTFKRDKVLCKNFGKRVSDFRKSLGITQEELSFRANISPSYTSAIERGITDVTISTAKRLAKALMVGINDLFV